jgi:hypothetical protein
MLEHEVLPILVLRNTGKFMVIQACPTHSFIIKFETVGLYQMQV